MAALEKQVGYWGRRLGFLGLALLNVWAVGIFFIVPAAIWLSSKGSYSGSGLRPGDVFHPLLWQTAWVSVLVALAAVLFAGSTALLATFSSKRVRNRLHVMMTLPLMIGFLARNYSWLGFLSYLSSELSPTDQSGSIEPILLYTRGGIVVVMGTVFIPFAYFIIIQGLASIKAAYYDAARSMGVSDERSFFAITVPIMSRAAIGAFMLCAVLAYGYFVTPRMIGGGKLDFVGNGVVKALNDLGDSALASGVAMLLFVSAIVPLIAFVIYSVKRRSEVGGG